MDRILRWTLLPIAALALGLAAPLAAEEAEPAGHDHAVTLRSGIGTTAGAEKTFGGKVVVTE